MISEKKERVHMSREKRGVNKIIGMFLLIGSTALLSAGSVQAAEQDRVLVWSEEFNADKLDKNTWSVATDNIYLENGCAVLPLKYQKQEEKWEEAWLSTEGKFGFRYGRLEARIKMTTYPGEYGAFWTMGYNKQSAGADGDLDGCRWSKCGEIDIMEEYDAGGTTANPGAALHWCDNWLNRNKAQGLGKRSLDTRQWHTYAMEWDEDKIEIFYDDISIGIIEHQTLDYYNNMNPFTMPQYILLTNVIKDVSAADKTLTPKMWVDWVRVYAPASETTLVKESEIRLEEAGTRKAIQNGRIAVGDSAYMNIAFEPEKVVNQSYQLISADEKVIRVNGNVLTAVSPGKTAVAAISPNGKTTVIGLEVYYDEQKKNLSKINLEDADTLLTQEKSWYWGEYSRSLDSKSQSIYTGLIRVSPNTTYEILTSNECLAAKLNVIEYRGDGTYIKWADYGKDNILKTGDNAAYIRLNMKLSKSGITMNYGDYMEYLKYSSFTINKK